MWWALLLLLPHAAYASVDWVFLIHLSGSASRWNTVSSTYCCRNTDTIKWIAFGETPPPNMDRIDFVRIAGSQGTKTTAAFEYARALYPTAEYITKLDDDTYFYPDEHMRYVREDAPGHMYYGYLNAHFQIPYASGGAGYTLHKSIVPKLSKCDARESIPEDYFVGKCVHPIPLHAVYSLHAQNPEYVIQEHIDDAGLKRPQSFHYVHEFDMFKLYTGGSLQTVHHVLEDNVELCDDGFDHTYWSLRRIRSELFRGSTNAPRKSRGLINAVLFDRSSRDVQRDIAALEILTQHGGIYLREGGSCVTESVVYDTVSDRQVALTAFSPKALTMLRRVYMTQEFPGWSRFDVDSSVR